MKHIGYKESAIDKDVQVPVFAFSKSELKVLYAILRKAQTYLPSLLTPDMGRVNSITKTIKDFLGAELYKKHPRSKDSGELNERGAGVAE